MKFLLLCGGFCLLLSCAITPNTQPLSDSAGEAARPVEPLSNVIALSSEVREKEASLAEKKRAINMQMSEAEKRLEALRHQYEVLESFNDEITSEFESAMAELKERQERLRALVEENDAGSSSRSIKPGHNEIIISENGSMDFRVSRKGYSH